MVNLLSADHKIAEIKFSGRTHVLQRTKAEKQLVDISDVLQKLYREILWNAILVLVIAMKTQQPLSG